MVLIMATWTTRRTRPTWMIFRSFIILASLVLDCQKASRTKTKKQLTTMLLSCDNRRVRNLRWYEWIGQNSLCPRGAMPLQYLRPRAISTRYREQRVPTATLFRLHRCRWWRPFGSGSGSRHSCSPRICGSSPIRSSPADTEEIREEASA